MAWGLALPRRARKELSMKPKTRTITLPRLGAIAATRAALGAGVALLVGQRLDRKPRQAVGWTLLGVGVLSTFPLIAGVLRGRPLTATS
jgi:hypothetical protein